MKHRVTFQSSDYTCKSKAAITADQNVMRFRLERARRRAPTHTPRHPQEAGTARVRRTSAACLWRHGGAGGRHGGDARRVARAARHHRAH
eukprot:4273459-Prymnesium_polylepis.1